MSKVSIEESTLTSIGNAIRSKTGESALLSPTDMPTAIESISGGGSERKALMIGSWNISNGVTNFRISDYISDYSKIKRITFRAAQSQSYAGQLAEFNADLGGYSGEGNGAYIHNYDTDAISYIFNVFDSAQSTSTITYSLKSDYKSDNFYYIYLNNYVKQIGITSKGYLSAPLYTNDSGNKDFQYTTPSMDSGYQYVIVEYEE